MRATGEPFFCEDEGGRGASRSSRYSNSRSRLQSSSAACSQPDQASANPAPSRQFLPVLAVGMPQDLIRRRPDIGSSDGNWQPDVVPIGVAVGGLSPAFSSGGLLGPSDFRASAEQFADCLRLGEHCIRLWGICAKLEECRLQDDRAPTFCFRMRPSGDCSKISAAELSFQGTGGGREKPGGVSAVAAATQGAAAAGDLIPQETQEEMRARGKYWKADPKH